MNVLIRGAAVAAAIAMLTPASLMAQGQGHQRGQMEMAPSEMMQATDMPMMQAMPMRPGPRMLLAQREALGLSDAQVERLEQLEDRLQAAVTEHRDEMATHKDQFAALRESEKLDIGRYEELLRQAADRRIAMQVERARIGQEAFDVLDDQQRSNVRYGMRMQRMMQPGAGMPTGHGMRGMMDGGMMGDQAAGMMDHGKMDHGKMMAMMQSMQQRMQQMRENCPASSGSGEN